LRDTTILSRKGRVAYCSTAGHVQLSGLPG
jgi:hypothetical protein